MEFILKIIFVLVLVGAAAYIAHIVDLTRNKTNHISFKEAMDLVELPIITFYNEGKKFNFLLDTGATISVIDSNALNNFTHEKIKESGVVYGMEGNTINVSFIKASLEHKGKLYSEEFQVVDMSSAFSKLKSESGVNLSGILGNSFFKKYQYVLDFESLIAYSKK